MVSKNKYRLLVGVVVILLATNLSMGLSFWYHKQQDKKAAEAKAVKVEMPSEQRTRFFREQLDLNAEQLDSFRELNREYNRNAKQISRRLQNLRLEMVQEMGSENPDTGELKKISEKIGGLHSDLKDLTIQYYLDMKQVCDSEQKEKLNVIFLNMSKSKEDVSLPQRGRKQHGRRSE